MNQISPRELAAWLADESRPAPFLLDVREPWEFERCHIENAHLMPMASVPMRAEELDPDAPTVVICHHGGRSMQVALFLERHGLSHVFNLAGGVAGWADQVDPAMPRY
ncbi:rhodanese-like domain-containing protein [Niveibacterium umoris]|uniref:Rhodanese-related sulfurtransferase n=1 Tax=Niveibacterium umoris TaxID=1193620 RepID=A0A840BH42_9RHOO|nr:rhodanese-like domain-containing protein [Niveibacterium umoris]MBB4012871.1 rhodanese-related sulfurtransferase [Niveibacterium umoris]